MRKILSCKLEGNLDSQIYLDSDYQFFLLFNVMQVEQKKVFLIIHYLQSLIFGRVSYSRNDALEELI